jgi:hypothetical protein
MRARSRLLIHRTGYRYVLYTAGHQSNHIAVKKYFIITINFRAHHAGLEIDVETV